MDATTNQRCIKGDFIGFTFGGVHSSKLGLMRVSDGSRYNEDLLPPLQDKKAQVAGRDGEIYFGSQYMTKIIRVPVAFDNMNEECFLKLKLLLSNKTPQILWFDETPYKQWVVKSANVQSFKWVCFDESRNGKKERIYKGEGTIEFNCFNSYATSNINYLDEAMEEKKDENNQPIYKEGYENIEQWRDGSGLKDKDVTIIYPASSGKENVLTKFGEYQRGVFIQGALRRGVLLYNAGHIPIKPKIICKIPDEEGYEQTRNVELRLYSFYNGSEEKYRTVDFEEIGRITISKDIIKKCKEDTKEQYPEQDRFSYFIVDSKLKMIKGASSSKTEENPVKELTGRIYNKYHKNGDYFEIPVSQDDIYFIEITDDQGSTTQGATPAETISISSIEYTHQYY